MGVSIDGTLASLGASFCALLSPNCYLFVSLGVSGSVHPCVSFSLSLSVCKVLFVSLSLQCLTLPLCLLITVGLRRPLGHLWAHQPPMPALSTLLCWSVPAEPFFALSSMGLCSSLRGALSWFPRPWSPNLSARSQVRRIDGAPFPVTEALESGAPMTAGLHSSLMSRGWEGSPLLEGVGEEKTGTSSPPTHLPPALPSSCLPAPPHLRTCIAPVHFHKLFPQEN